MIISASRRTDIPNYYADWFYRRVQEGFCYVRNPMNPHQVSIVRLSSEVVDGIVFWTKNPAPMMERLGELSGYPFYFQFTLTGYGADIESGVPHKREVVLPTFLQLSRQLGSRRVIWRYDPILFTDRYTPDYHRNAFAQIARALRGATDQCVISFVDTYHKNKKQLEQLQTYYLNGAELEAFVQFISETAHKNGMKLTACAEQTDLTAFGIAPSACIDKARLEELGGFRLKVGKDKNQRPECGCVESVDIGVYNTCRNGCRYCYANTSSNMVQQSCGAYDVNSPLLCGTLAKEDQLTERTVRSMREMQTDLQDLLKD